MAVARTRDKVWGLIIARIRKGEALTVRDVVEREGCAERTARDVLEVAANQSDLLDVHEEETRRRVYRPKVSLGPRDERGESEL